MLSIKEMRKWIFLKEKKILDAKYVNYWFLLFIANFLIADSLKKCGDQ